MAHGHRVLIFGSYDRTLHPRVAVLRDGLQARGWTVRELNEPLGASTADKVAAAKSPAAAVHLAGRQGGAWARLARRSPGARANGGPDVVLVGYMGHADVHLARLLFPKSLIVLDHLTGLAETVADRGLGRSAKLGVLQAADRAALGQADLIVVDTAQQAAALPEAQRAKAVVVPVGAEESWFRAAEAEGFASDRLKVVFFGLFTPLQGAEVIGEAMASLAEAPIDFTMIGSGQDLALAQSAAATNPNVSWVDWVDAAQLPALVARQDVCLGVFGAGPKTQRVIPTKVYQGMAAGCAIVTGRTIAASALGDAVITVPVGDARALAAALRGLAEDKELLRMAKQRARSGAERYRPAQATEELDARLAQGVQSRSPLPPLTLNAWLRWGIIGPELERIGAVDVLEIGPGEGAAACRLAQGRRYTGVELSARARQVAEARLEALGTPGRLLGGLDELEPSEDFDLVCSFQVIEHIEDDHEAFLQWVRRLRPGGALIVSTPAGPHRMGAADLMVGHFRRYTADQLQQMARDAGLVNIRTIHTGYPFGYALEAYRNAAARRVLAKEEIVSADSAEQADLAKATEMSGSRWQPPSKAALATRAISAPGRWMQRLRPGVGTGLLLFANAPR